MEKTREEWKKGWKDRIKKEQRRKRGYRTGNNREEWKKGWKDRIKKEQRRKRG